MYEYGVATLAAIRAETAAKRPMSGLRIGELQPSLSCTARL